MMTWLTGVMTTTDVAPTAIDAQLDADLAARLERLASRKASPESTPIAGPSSAPKRRRHPARKSRYAALALSLVTTGGLSAGFAAMDGPSSSVVTASGGIVTIPVATAGPVTTVGPVVTTAPAASAQAPLAALTTVNGDVYTNKWGPVQVQVAFAADGTLATVDTIQTPYLDGKSVRINDRAVPVLNSEALASQTAQVDTVSGATYTSIDYEHSLQSAIDAARVAGLTQLV